MLPAKIRGKIRKLGDVVSVTTARDINEFGVLADYNDEDDEVLISFSPSHDGDWYSLDENLDDVKFVK